MSKRLAVVKSDGTVALEDVCRLSYLLILASLVYLTALAVNEFFQKLLEQYVRKDGLLGYFVYALAAVFVVILVVYLGCRWDHRLADFIDISPV